MLLKEVMTPFVEIIPFNCSLKKAAQKMKQHDIGTLPIHNGDDKLVGMITDRDIAVKAVAEGADPNTAVVQDFMTKPIVYCFDDQDVTEGLSAMASKKLRRLIILDRNKRMVGIVSIGDIALRSQDPMAPTLHQICEHGSIEKVA
jgi:CBS domain-containing protein